MSISKIEFIRRSFPDFMQINALTDQHTVSKIKDHLLEHGFYTKNHEMLQTSVMNLILRAQGKFENRKVFKKRNEK